MTTPAAAPFMALSPIIGAAATDVSERLATYLAGVPADLRDAALMAYRKVTMALLLKRGMTEEKAEPLIEEIVADIRKRLSLIERAGGGVAGRA